MAWVSDDYLGLAMYRLRMALHDHGVPIVPRLLSRLCIALFGIRIGDHALILEGLYLPHGNVVIDGPVVIGRRVVIAPWVTIGVRQNNLLGPLIGDGAFLGTGAKIIGNVMVGRSANVGAGAVVLDDVPDNASVGGVPARVLLKDQA